MQDKVVNYHLLEAAFGYLEIAEANNRGPLGLDSHDEACMKSAFQYVRTIVSGWSSHMREKLKLSFAYFIHKPEILEFEVLANAQDLTIRKVDDYVQLFKWLYEVLFPDDPIESIDISNVVEINNIMEINSVRREF